jgi:hypothetical protein
MVAAILQELVLKVAIRPVQLDAVEPGLTGIAGGLGELGDYARNLIDAQFAGNRKFDTAGRQEEVASRRYRRRPDGLFAAAHVRVSDAATMPDLAVNAAARGVNRVGDLPPSRDLVGTVQARRANDAMRLVRDLNALSDDQSG